MIDWRQVNLLGTRTPEEKEALQEDAERQELVDSGAQLYAGKLICGLPVDWFYAWMAENMSSEQRARVRYVRKMCARWQNNLDKQATEMEMLKAQLAEAQGAKPAKVADDEEEAGLDLDAYRARVTEEVRRIPPKLYATTLRKLLEEGNPWALKAMSDQLGLAVQAKEAVLDDRPPVVNFNYTVDEPTAPEPPKPVKLRMK